MLHPGSFLKLRAYMFVQRYLSIAVVVGSLTCHFSSIGAASQRDDSAAAEARVAADIDGHVISIAEIEKNAMRRYGQEILDNLIDNYLIEREARRLNIEASQAEIDNQVRALIEAIKPKTLEEGLNAHHQTLAELQDDFRHRLLGLRLAAQGAKPGHFVHARVILLRTGTEMHMDSDALALVATIQDRLKAGARFEDLAKQYSQDQSAKDRGGDIGVLFEGAPYDAGLVEAATALKAGEVTAKPVITPSGYYLIKAISTDKEHPRDENKLYEDAQWHYEMYQGSRNLQTYLRGLRAGAAIREYLKE
jgi:foldase protein PrsA